MEEYKDYKRYDENDVLMILKGIRDILFYFLNANNNSNNNGNSNNKELNGNKYFNMSNKKKVISDEYSLS